MHAERLTAEGFATLRLVIRLAGLYELVETTGVRILTRGATTLGRILWIGEDREVLHECEHDIYVIQKDSQCWYTHHTAHVQYTIQYIRIMECIYTHTIRFLEDLVGLIECECLAKPESTEHPRLA